MSEELVQAGLSTLENPIVQTGGGLVGIALLGRWAWRLVSSDRLALVKDRAETDVVSVLQRERDVAMERADKERDRAESAITARDEAIAQLNESTAKIAALSAEVHALREQVASLKTDVQWLREQLVKKLDL